MKSVLGLSVSISPTALGGLPQTQATPGRFLFGGRMTSYYIDPRIDISVVLGYRFSQLPVKAQLLALNLALIQSQTESKDDLSIQDACWKLHIPVSSFENRFEPIAKAGYGWINHSNGTVSVCLVEPPEPSEN